MVASHRLIAKMPTLAAMAYKYSAGQPFLYPDNDLSYTGNFLRMTFGVPAEEYVVDPVVEAAMDKIFILHADHEQNASTSRSAEHTSELQSLMRISYAVFCLKTKQEI